MESARIKAVQAGLVSAGVALSAKATGWEAPVVERLALLGLPPTISELVADIGLGLATSAVVLAASEFATATRLSRSFFMAETSPEGAFCEVSKYGRGGYCSWVQIPFAHDRGYECLATDFDLGLLLLDGELVEVGHWHSEGPLSLARRGTHFPVRGFDSHSELESRGSAAFFYTSTRLRSAVTYHGEFNLMLGAQARTLRSYGERLTSNSHEPVPSPATLQKVASRLCKRHGLKVERNPPKR